MEHIVQQNFMVIKDSLGLMVMETYRTLITVMVKYQMRLLKQDIVDASSQWDDIKAVKVRKFRF